MPIIHKANINRLWKVERRQTTWGPGDPGSAMVFIIYLLIYLLHTSWNGFWRSLQPTNTNRHTQKQINIPAFSNQRAKKGQPGRIENFETITTLPQPNSIDKNSSHLYPHQARPNGEPRLQSSPGWNETWQLPRCGVREDQGGKLELLTHLLPTPTVRQWWALTPILRNDWETIWGAQASPPIRQSCSFLSTPFAVVLGRPCGKTGLSPPPSDTRVKEYKC